MRILIFAILIITITNEAGAYFCEDPANRGKSVRIIEDTSLNDIGVASLAPDGKFTIRWNPNIANKMGSVLAEFFKYHECAHIQDVFYTKGKILKVYPPLKESRADCLALIAMKRDEKLGRTKFENILDRISKLPTTNVHTHFPGRKRALVIIDDCMLQNNLQ